MVRRWLMVPGLLIAALLIAVAVLITLTRRERLATVFLGGKEFSLEIADTPLRIATGLSGRERIPENGGMLFVFSTPDRYTFWMKGMLIPIDIIWIRGETIIGLVEAAAPPTADAPDTALIRYIPPQPVDRVIELSAGRAAELGLAVGQMVRVALP